MFRQEALDRLNSPDELDTMVSVVSPATWVAVAATCVLAAAALGWSLFGTVKETVRETAVLAFAETRETHVAAAAEGFVQQVLVAPGEAVRAGQPMVTLATAALDREIAVAERRQAVARQVAADPQTGTDRLAVTLARLQEEKEAAATVTAPSDGRVVAVGARAGAPIQFGEPLVTLAEDSGPLVAEAWFADDKALALKPGMAATVVLPAAGGAGTAVVHGEVEAVADRLVPRAAVAPASDAAQGGMVRRVTIALDDAPADGAATLLPGADVALTITVGETAPLALVLPSLAPILAR